MGQPITSSTTLIYPPPPTSSSHSSPQQPRSSSPSSRSSSHSKPHHPSDTAPPTTSSSSSSYDALCRHIHILDLARLALAVLIIGAGAAVVGCSAHALSAYNNTSRMEGVEAWGIPALWPASLDVRGMVGMLVGGSVVVAGGLGYVGLGIVPVPQRLHLLTILMSASLSAVGLTGAVVGVAYTASIRNGAGYERDDIQSWTCRWVDGAANVNKLFENGLAGIAYPTGFQRVCKETHWAFNLSAVLICMEMIVVVVTGLCAWMEVKLRKMEGDDEVSGFGEKEPQTDVDGRTFY